MSTHTRRQPKKFAIGDELLTAREIAARHNVTIQTAYRMGKRGRISPLPSGPSPRELTHNNLSLTIAAWSKRLGVGVATLHYRLKRGWPLDRVLAARNLPIQLADGTRCTTQEAADRIGISVNTLRTRLKLWSTDEALNTPPLKRVKVVAA